MKLAISLVLGIVAITIGLIHAQRPQSFLSACNPLVSQEIMFTGVCSIRFPFDLLGQIADLIRSAPDTQTLDSFLRERAFKGIVQFFRDTYSKVFEPDECSFVPSGSEDLTPYLDALQSESLKFADRLLEPGCLTTIWVGEFSNPFYDSKFSDIRFTVSSLFYCNHPDWQDCGSGNIGFCPNTKELFKVDSLYEITNRIVDNLLCTYANTIYFNYTLPAHLLGKNAFDLLVTKIDAVGTGGTLMSDVKAFTNSEFYEGIRGWYLNETATTTRKTTTTTTTTTTTRTTPTTVPIPVSDLVIYLVPSLVVFLGIIAAVIVIALLYSFRPVVIQVQPQTIMNGAGGYVNQKQPETIKMEKIEKMPTTV